VGIMLTQAKIVQDARRMVVWYLFSNFKIEPSLVCQVLKIRSDGLCDKKYPARLNLSNLEDRLRGSVFTIWRTHYLKHLNEALQYSDVLQREKSQLQRKAVEINQYLRALDPLYSQAKEGRYKELCLRVCSKKYDCFKEVLERLGQIDLKLTFLKDSSFGQKVKAEISRVNSGGYESVLLELSDDGVDKENVPPPSIKF
jgi:hypothetical protein